MSGYKLVPVEPTAEMLEAYESASIAPVGPISKNGYRAMLAAAPDAKGEPIGFCEDTALSLAERTFRSEVDEQLAEDVIQYARRLHELYATPQPTPDVPGLTEALRQYQHNDGSGLVFGYDRLLVDQYIAVLVDALEGIMRVEARDRIMPVGAEWDAARAALAAHRKGGEA